MGIREEKKGNIKYQLLMTTLDLMKEKPFSCVTVKEICSRNDISEVTFFKFFKMKEEILQYFMLTWNFKRIVRLKQEGEKRGLTAIYSIFEDIASTDNSLSIMTSLISFISDLKKQPRQLTLETYDKYAIIQNTEYTNMPVEELEAQIFRHLKEAIANDEIHKSIDLLRTVKMIAGIFYGVPLVSHMSFSTDFFGDYKDSLDYLFIALKHGRREVFYEK